MPINENRLKKALAIYKDCKQADEEKCHSCPLCEVYIMGPRLSNSVCNGLYDLERVLDKVEL